jgi:hypothetical protein
MVRKQRAKARRSLSAQVKAQIYNVDLLQRALAWIVRGEIFDHLPQHGNTSWLPTQLIVLAILWVWSDQSQLTKAYEEGRRAALKFYEALTLASYQGFIRALTSWTEQLRPLLWLRLQQLMEQVAGVYWRRGEFLVLAVDGSRVSVPRTKSNEQAFAAKNYGQGKKARSRAKWKNKKRRSKKLGSPVKPQIWLTMIWHVGLKMPWCWRTGPSTSSERGHFLALLKSCAFPQKTLFCADAGFVGYELWKAIADAGHDFLIRVGGNVVLLRKLGRVRVERDIVFFWPKVASQQKLPPLMLRLLEFQGARGPVYLLTTVLDPRRLSLKKARELYKQRWGIELQFRTLKQTFGRTKLRSRSADRALVELEWSLFGLWIIQLFAAKEQIEIENPPSHSSAALAIAVFRELLRDQHRIIASPKVLHLKLREAVQDDYERASLKRSRYKSTLKDQPTTTSPKIHVATKQQRRAYQALNTAA